MKKCKECKHIKIITWQTYGPGRHEPPGWYNDGVCLCLRLPPTGGFTEPMSDTRNFKGARKTDLCKYEGYIEVSKNTVACGEFELRKKL